MTPVDDPQRYLSRAKLGRRDRGSVTDRACDPGAGRKQSFARLRPAEIKRAAAGEPMQTVRASPTPRSGCQKHGGVDQDGKQHDQPGDDPALGYDVTAS
jgi:hypothetical protein